MVTFDQFLAVASVIVLAGLYFSVVLGVAAVLKDVREYDERHCQRLTPEPPRVRKLPFDQDAVEC